MGVETFTKDEFQAALPENAVPLGLEEGEHCWLVPITETAGILVRSSIDRRGVSGACGEDSIRVYPAICKPMQAPIGIVYPWRVRGSTEARWITRVRGWQRRLQDSLAYLEHLIVSAGNCPECGEPRTILKVKKPGPNRGRWFAVCDKHKQFIWISGEQTS